MARVLRPGGRLVILEFFRPTRLLTRIVHTIYNRTVLPVVGWACTGNLGAYLYLPRSIAGFTSAQDYEALLSVQGFRNVKVRHLAMGVASIVVADKASEESSAR
jgi:ubiquinone/menaquinone biosynthesis C-methylase UbiE